MRIQDNTLNPDGQDNVLTHFGFEVGLPIELELPNLRCYEFEVQANDITFRANLDIIEVALD